MIDVLVTAKDGQLGQCFQSLAVKHPNIQFVFKSSSDLDITSTANIEEALKDHTFDYCINCAAYTAVDKAEEAIELADKVNHIGAKLLAESCKKFNVTLIHVSTDFVFDGKATVPYLEDDITNPLGVYGKTKLAGEQAISNVLENYFIIRTSWLYSEYGNNFLKTMLRLSKERNEIGVVGDQVGSPTYARDLADIILRLIESKNTSYGVYHYSNKGVVSWYDFAKEIFKLSDSSITLNKIETKDYPTPAVRPKYSVLHTESISKLLDLKIPNWKESLKKAIIYLKDNK
ncbi:dTDP-4-dehydrorhamnose reductase [Winogradskyella psychrotolerans]|uniref:dTDP-4-dehydrorhamnose reductase n=1 Tax=Winogradskyella psychrotolerans TaxID=1344585 RepID=UPI001C0690EA|nr:dTDP-4-dehydrorhamnose reductase [Winogradskyella psychrotolerans]MBU2921643.1 dTDP-4-dehydrorhamnose reductase [Winogradskyella psychrotolerans]